MTTMTLDSQANRLRRTHGEVIRKSRLAAFWPLTSLGIVLAYLVYAWVAFDVSGVFGAADWNLPRLPFGHHDHCAEHLQAGREQLLER